MELEAGEEEWDPDTSVETLSWEQLKKFLARGIVQAVKVACDNLIESYYKEGSEKIKKGNDCTTTKGKVEESDCSEDRTKQSFQNLLNIEEKEEQGTSKDLTSTTIEFKIQPSGKKAAKRLRRKKKKNRRRKEKDAEKNWSKKLKRRKGRKEASLQVGKMVLKNELQEYRNFRHILEIQKEKEALERGGRMKRQKLCKGEM
ncbi:UNVERIFIED_CONTAM: hypothetical protein K2H54_055207 [Gekko kuhli]